MTRPAPDGALVLGAGIRALGVARSLGRHGVPVRLLGEPADSMARWSRHVAHYEPWPATEEARVASLYHLAARGTAGWMLFPTDDEAAGLVARRRDELSAVYRVLSSGWDVVETASDKRRAYRLAAELAVPCPRTFVPADAAELQHADLEFPVILKPAMKTVANAFTDAKAWPAADRSQLLALYERAVRLVPPGLVMIQELVPGDGAGQLSFAALCVDGEVLASLVVRRTRQFPVDFGHSSSFVESVVDDEVEQLGRLVLGRLGFTGLVEAEFKRSPIDRRPRLLDINPRVWTWHSLGRRAGVDFPYLAWRTVHGDPPTGLRGRAGARWMRPATDIFAARTGLRAGTLTWHRYLREARPPVEMAPWLATDPLPALADLPLLAARAARRARANRVQTREVRAVRARSGAPLDSGHPIGRAAGAGPGPGRG